MRVYVTAYIDVHTVHKCPHNERGHIMIIHSTVRTTRTTNKIRDVEKQWGDGLLTDLERIHKIDKLMFDYLKVKKIIHEQ